MDLPTYLQFELYLLTYLLGRDLCDVERSHVEAAADADAGDDPSSEEDIVCQVVSK